MAMGLTYDTESEDKQAVVSVMFKNETQSLYVGGNFRKFNNLYKFEYIHLETNDNATDRKNHSFFTLPKETQQVSERRERALRKRTSILAMDLAKWLQT